MTSPRATPSSLSAPIDLARLEAIRPASVERLGAAIRAARARGWAIYPRGGGTAMDYGHPPTRPGQIIETTGLDRVIDYPSRDMTITVEAGIRLARLDALLGAEGQRLPVDSPHRDRATLGGLIATNTSGPRRYAAGTIRDYVIGITVVNADGVAVRAGGRVVKNVAGYDLCKLYTGSLGTLGVISQVTLKLRPRPPHAALAWVTFDSTAPLAPVLDRLTRSRTRPACLELLNRHGSQAIVRAAGAGLPPADRVVVIGFEGAVAAVEWQAAQIRQELAGTAATSVELLSGPATGPVWDALIEGSARDDAAVTIRANLLASAVPGFLDTAEALAGPIALQAHAGNGIVIGHFPEPQAAEPITATVRALRRAAVQAKGNLIVPRAPAEWKPALEVWGEPRPDWSLMRRIKTQLDPDRAFNPGRFLDLDTGVDQPKVPPRMEHR